MRDIMSTKPKDSATQAVRELGWVFSSFEPDPTIDQTKRSGMREPRDAGSNANRIQRLDAA